MHQTRHAAAVLEEQRDGIRLKQGALRATGAQMLVDKEGDLAVGQGPQAHAHGDALRERVVLRLGQPLAQQRLAREDEGERAFFVEAVGGEQAQVLERCVGHGVRLIEHDDGFLGQPAQVRDQIVCGLPLEAPGTKTELGAEQTQQAEGLQARERRVDDQIRGRVELAAQAAEHGGLAAAALGAEQRDAVAVDSEVQSLERVLEALVV